MGLQGESQAACAQAVASISTRQAASHPGRRLPSTRTPPVCHRLRARSTGAGRPQCLPRANYDGCAYLQTVAHSLLAGQRGQAPAVLAPANCDGCAYLRPVHPHTHAASAPRSQWAGGSDRLLDWCLKRSIRKPSDPLPARVAVP